MIKKIVFVFIVGIVFLFAKSAHGAVLKGGGAVLKGNGAVLKGGGAVLNGNIIGIPEISVSVPDEDDPQKTATTVQMLFLLTILAIVPSILLMMTCFPRIIISLHFIRSALGTQQMPPNQVLISLAIFLTMFMMRDQITEIMDGAFKPYSNGEISQEVAIDKAMSPLRGFMMEQVKQTHLDLFARMADTPYDKNDSATIPNSVLIPAFMVGEITAAFQIGVIIYIPFIVIDMVVASVLMAMGMMMLPPAMISLPFKILIFVLVDGWTLTLRHVFESFAR